MRQLKIILLWCGLLLVACAGNATPTPPAPTIAPTLENPLAGLEGGVLAEFRVVDETFTLWSTNPETMSGLINLLSGPQAAFIPSGPVLTGPGVAEHNAPYGWHLDPAQTVLVEAADPDCNWVPSLIEADVTAYIAEHTRFCPSVVELVRVLDLR